MTKRIASLLFVLVSATGASAQDSLSAQLTACLPISGMLQRLACYDRVAHSLGPAPRSAPVQRPLASAPPPVAYVPPVAAAAPPVMAAAPPTGLGSERLPRTASAVPRRAQELIANVASVTYDPRSRFTITLDNGQVWRQLEGDTTVLQGAQNATVRISRGALGSYDLNVVGRNATYRVLRLQ
jgi:hypothetical protein